MSAFESSVDVEIHGLVGLQLRGASAGDVANVVGQVGGVLSPLHREPDIVIQFRDLPATRSNIRFLGGEFGFTEDAFLVLDESRRVVAELRLNELGEQPTLLCQSGLGAVPLLVPAIDLTFLTRGLLPLHASAFAWAGVGSVVMGWPKGGKTSALLGFMSSGAEFVADDRAYIRGSDHKVFGLATMLELSHRHLRELSDYRHALGRGERARLRALAILDRHQRVSERRSTFQHVRRRATSMLRGQLALNVEPHRLFDGQIGARTCSFDRLFIMVGHDGPTVAIDRLKPHPARRRLMSLLRFERTSLMTAYLKFRFAFPDRNNPTIEKTDELEEDLLAQLLPGRELYIVRHPSPTSPVALYKAMRPYCE
jgi:hypothetical protein